MSQNLTNLFHSYLGNLRICFENTKTYINFGKCYSFNFELFPE